MRTRGTHKDRRETAGTHKRVKMGFCEPAVHMKNVTILFKSTVYVVDKCPNHIPPIHRCSNYYCSLCQGVTGALIFIVLLHPMEERWNRPKRLPKMCLSPKFQEYRADSEPSTISTHLMFTLGTHKGIILSLPSKKGSTFDPPIKTAFGVITTRFFVFCIIYDHIFTFYVARFPFCVGINELSPLQTLCVP
jgi:hypothetical protein